MKHLIALIALLCATFAFTQSTSLAPGGEHVIVPLDTTEATRTQELVVPTDLDSLFVGLAHSADVQVDLTDPDGRSVTPTAEDMGETQWNVPSPAVGTWVVTLTHDQAERRSVQLEAFYNGRNVPRIGVMVPYMNIGDEDITVSVALFEGGDPVEGAEVDVRIVSGDGADLGSSEAQDTGRHNAGDAHAGDGVYSTQVASPPPGFYGARATAHLPNGTTLATMEFFEVFEITGRLDGSWSDAGEDRNDDDLIDAIILDFGVDIERPGDYAVEALLRASNGNEVWTRNGAASLTRSSGTIRTELLVDDISEKLGEGGPYEVVNARLLWTPRSDGITPRTHIASELNDLGYTRAYDLGDLDRPYLLFTRYLGDEGVDTNGNGQFDFIRVQFEIDSALRTQHVFAWNARLMPGTRLPDDGRPSFASNQGTIHAGPNTLTLEFPVEEYALNGVSGTFDITTPSLYPTRALPHPYNQASGEEFQQLPRVLGTTRAYTLAELEGGLPSTLPALIAYVKAMPFQHPGNSANALRQQLVSSLEHAHDAQTAGRNEQAENQVNAFLNAMNAQAGKTIAGEDANVCLQAVDVILADL